MASAKYNHYNNKPELRCRRKRHRMPAATCRPPSGSRPAVRPRLAGVLVPVLVPGLLAAGAETQAQDDPPAAESIETIVVTASRLPVSAEQAAASFTVLDQEYLDRRQALTVGELLRAVPGVAVSRSGGLGALTQVRLRGSEANHALVLMDGIEIGDPAIGGELDFSHMLADGVRRIEIVRGPLSALWGSDAVAGAINLISAPREYGPLLSSSLEAGQFDTRRANLSAGAAGDAWGVHFSGNHLSSDGQNISRSGDEADGYRNNTGHLVAEFNPSNRLLLRVTARRAESGSEYDALTGGLPADSNNSTRRTHSVAGLQGRLSLLDGRWLHRGGITHSGSENRNLASGSQTSETKGDKLRFSYQSSLFFERADPAALPSITLGLGHEREDYVQRAAASSFGDPNRDLSARSSEALAEFRMDARNRWSASAALRYDRNQHFGNAFSWRASAVRHTGASVKLHAAYGIGVKNPTFIERFGYFSNFIGNPSILPEEARGWEAGASFATPGRAFSGSATWFSERLLDEINGFVFDPAAGGFTAANRTGVSRRRGLELQAHWKAARGFALTGTYTWLRSKEPGTGADAAEAVHELRRPRHSGSLDIHYETADPNLDFNLHLDFTGEVADIFYPPWPSPARRVSLDSFLLAGLTAAWQVNPRMRWHIRADNLGQARYEEVFGFRGPGRSIHLGVRLSLLDTRPRN